MTVVIRRATGADADVLASLNAEVQALHAQALPWWFKPPGSASRPAADSLPNHLVFVADVESTPVGYAYAEIIRQPETAWRYAYEMAYIHHIGVRAAYRGRGVGRALLEAVRSAASEAGVSLVGLDVWSFNEDARAFFRRCGFSPYVERLWLR